jgi:hypothetical protein
MSLKQSAKDSTVERERADGDVSKCWRRERDRLGVRVEVRPDEVFIFPYQQLFFAHLIHIPAGAILKITFSTHEISVAGNRLEKLVGALQEFAVDWIRPLPARYRDLGESNEPVITSIEVKVLNE